ncbi:hypothetical protein [Sinorhizobium meliloti]|uniref:hypothetical protein n=1 Tax=Rhizobium meliloti TaxID=382 RepID=UPI0001E4AB69|nr:hypothetical protein [Sinorhizobium meliloti]AEG53158.1 hypothetical protein Sinme_1411 [Sinorhizobium meliloti AK83]MDE4591127.1 hypothetical protein [Sinorhizobium meliloti]SEI56248.1 hypothetical protein SAMN04244575_01059 [Sinorhizobium meliloti]
MTPEEIAHNLLLAHTGMEGGCPQVDWYKLRSEISRAIAAARPQYHPPVGHGHFRVPLKAVEPVAKYVAHKDPTTHMFAALPAASKLGAGIHFLYATPAIDGQLIAAFTQAREKLVMTALSQNTTGRRETYGDGFSQGIFHAVEAICAAFAAAKEGAA